MGLMGASLALGGATGCSRPPLETIVPYRDGPAQGEYGKPVFYATALACDTASIGVLVECNMGRPTKIEGNPLHPGSRGATDVPTQAAILDVWDPERSQSVRQGTATATWDDAIAALQARVRLAAGASGEGLCLLTETVRSPTLHAAIARLLARLPGASWHQWQPLNRDRTHEGARLAYGQALEPLYRFAEARAIVALDADFLGTMTGHVRHASDFADTRRAEAAANARSRLYVLEPVASLTGAAADHRLPVRAFDVALAAHALAHALGIVATPPARSVMPPAWLAAAVADLRGAGERALVVVGERQPAAVHALAHAINEHLHASGTTVVLMPPVADAPVDHAASLRELTDRMRAGRVKTLVIAGSNPVYDAPADVRFDEALTHVEFTLHHGLYRDETAARCAWHVPAAHALESWGDLRSVDGTLALQQPCIEPLYGGRSTLELVASMAGDAAAHGRNLVQAQWRDQHAASFDVFFEDALRKGVVPRTAAAPLRPALRPGAPDWIHALDAAAPAAASVDIVFTPDPHVGAGAQANNAWLQELPRPLTQLTWDNAAEIAPSLAARLGLASEDVVELKVADHRLEAPVWIVPGLPDDTVVLALGYGRTHAGSVGNGRGVDANALRTTAAPWFASGVTITRLGWRHALASAQSHHSMERRDVVRTVSLAQAGACSSECKAGTPDDRTLYDSPPLGPYAWAMSIDLSACIGCGTCTIACQAENNIPTVGKEEVKNGREMHWIRVDRYFQGPVSQPRTVFQPVPCMQCEHAPCEVVCPVEASVHDAQGINVQVYNRCVGTRFCSNNCPYKVRRFNFLQYAQDVPQLDAQRNPEVTVRMRGVMEKCNYCLQRITTARIGADREGRRLQDGEVVTACQAACPTRAIVFGDLNDPASAVRRRKALPLDYALLAELNTRPRTTYIARITNEQATLRDAGPGAPR